MNIKKYVKECVALSFVLIIAGALISTVGFESANFNYEKLKENNLNNAWYQTVHISDEGTWYGVDLGHNIHLFNIGCAE